MSKKLSLLILVIILAPFVLTYLWFNQPFDAGLSLFYSLQGLALSLVVGLSIYTYKSGQVPASKRALWIALFIFANMVVFPFFWYFYMWNSHNETMKNDAA